MYRRGQSIFTLRTLCKSYIEDKVLIQTVNMKFRLFSFVHKINCEIMNALVFIFY